MQAHNNPIERQQNIVASLAAEIEANHGKKGNAARRETLAAAELRLLELKAKKMTLRRQWQGPKSDPRSEWKNRAWYKGLRRRDIADASLGILQRGIYGELGVRWELNVRLGVHALRQTAEEMCKRGHPAFVGLTAHFVGHETIRKAVSNGLVPGDKAEFNKRGRGEAVNKDIYASTANGQLVLVQVRHFTRTKYSSTRYEYAVTDGENVIWLENGVKNLVKRAGKQEGCPVDGPLQAIYKHLPAEWQARVKPVLGEDFKLTGPAYWHYGWKLMQEIDGVLCSLWDASPWTGNKRHEPVAPAHGGGLYCYLTKELAKKLATAEWVQKTVQADDLRLVEVAFRGPILRYGDKIAASTMKPISVFLLSES